VRFDSVLLLCALTACHSDGYAIVPDSAPLAPPLREFIIDDDFTLDERNSLTFAIHEWNRAQIITPHITYRPVEMHPIQIMVTECDFDVVYIQRGYPSGEDTTGWGNAGESFWVGLGHRALVYVQVQEYRVYLHELGHSFGLGHTDDPGCIMYGGVLDTVEHVTPCDWKALCEVWGCEPP